ncbi:hypothetical protein ACJX0J_007546, partial [Zea mays]
AKKPISFPKNKKRHQGRISKTTPWQRPTTATAARRAAAAAAVAAGSPSHAKRRWRGVPECRCRWRRSRWRRLAPWRSASRCFSPPSATPTSAPGRESARRSANTLASWAMRQP